MMVAMMVMIRVTVQESSLLGTCFAPHSNLSHYRYLSSSGRIPRRLIPNCSNIMGERREREREQLEEDVTIDRQLDKYFQY